MTEATCARLHQIIELSHKYDTHTNARIRELVKRIFDDEGADTTDLRRELAARERIIEA